MDTCPQATGAVSTGAAVESSKPWEEESSKPWEEERGEWASSGEPQAGEQWGSQGGQGGGGEGWDEQLEELVMGGEWDEEPEAGDWRGDVLGERAELDKLSDGSVGAANDTGEAVSDEQDKSVSVSEEMPELLLKPEQWPQAQDEWPEMKQMHDELPEVEQGMRGQQDEKKEEVLVQDEDLVVRQAAREVAEESVEQPDEGIWEERDPAAADGGAGVWGEGWRRHSPSPDSLEPPDSLEASACQEERTAVESPVGQYHGRLELYVEEDRSEAILAPGPVLFQDTPDGISEEVHVPRPTPSPGEDFFTTPPSTPPALHRTPSPLPASLQKPLDSYGSPNEGASPRHDGSTPSSQDYEQLSHASSLEWSAMLEEALARPHPQEGERSGLVPQEDYYTPEVCAGLPVVSCS